MVYSTNYGSKYYKQYYRQANIIWFFLEITLQDLEILNNIKYIETIYSL